MSYYTERYVRWGKEGTWGTAAATDAFFNYLERSEATTTENRSEEAVIGGGRGLRKRCWLQREVTGVFEHEPISARFFEFILGSVSPNDTVAPFQHTLMPTTIVPSFTVERQIRQPGEGMKYWGCKVDTAELTCEQGEAVGCVINWVGKDAATIAAAWTPATLDFDIEPFAFHHGKIAYGGTTLTYVNRCVLSINNNLSARLSVGGTIGTAYTAQELREGELEVSGRLMIGYPIGSIAKDVLARQESTLVLTLAKTGQTIEITVNNIALTEYADALAGLDPYEVEFPFTARETGTQVAIKVVSTGNKGTFSDYVP